MTRRLIAEVQLENDMEASWKKHNMAFCERDDPSRRTRVSGNAVQQSSRSTMVKLVINGLLSLWL